MPFAPEFFRKEFNGVVADMKNSVEARNNAPSACAAQFISNHRPSSAPLAALRHRRDGHYSGRASGYGVGLLLEPGSLSQGLIERAEQLTQAILQLTGSRQRASQATLNDLRQHLVTSAST